MIFLRVHPGLQVRGNVVVVDGVLIAIWSASHELVGYAKADVLASVGDKWTIVVVGALSNELTELGQTLRGALVPLHLWAARNKAAIARNRMAATSLPKEA